MESLKIILKVEKFLKYLLPQLLANNFIYHLFIL